MPWCAECSRFLSPSTVRSDGTCPACGRTVEQGSVATKADDEPLPPVPWHLKLLAVGIAAYLAYRLFQGIEWVAG